MDATNKNRYYKVKFIETGTIKEARKDHIINGNVRDEYKPIIFNIGYMGISTTNGNMKAYKTWYHMLSRCYDKNFKHYDIYGGKGVNVNKRWHCFEYFLEDIKGLEGYDEWLKNKEYQIDKDIKGDGMSYSKGVCIFIHRIENCKARGLEVRIVAISPEGNIIKHLGIHSFARQYNLSPQAIWKCLNNKLKSTGGGWKFEYAK